MSLLLKKLLRKILSSMTIFFSAKKNIINLTGFGMSISDRTTSSFKASCQIKSSHHVLMGFLILSSQVFPWFSYILHSSSLNQWHTFYHLEQQPILGKGYLSFLSQTFCIQVSATNNLRHLTSNFLWKSPSNEYVSIFSPSIIDDFIGSLSVIVEQKLYIKD